MCIEKESNEYVYFFHKSSVSLIIVPINERSYECTLLSSNAFCLYHLSIQSTTTIIYLLCYFSLRLLLFVSILYELFCLVGWLATSHSFQAISLHRLCANSISCAVLHSYQTHREKRTLWSTSYSYWREQKLEYIRLIRSKSLCALNKKKIALGAWDFFKKIIIYLIIKTHSKQMIWLEASLMCLRLRQNFDSKMISNGQCNASFIVIMQKFVIVGRLFLFKRQKKSRTL